MIAADPAAALVGYLSTILATFGLFEWLGLTADQVAILGGAILGLVATLRLFYEKGRRRAHEVLHTAHEDLKRRTNQFEVSSKEELEELRKLKRPAADA